MFHQHAKKELMNHKYPTVISVWYFQIAGSVLSPQLKKLYKDPFILIYVHMRNRCINIFYT